MRKIEFENGEYYHIYNRGVDKREVFGDDNDYLRFLKSMVEFNRIDPIGSLYEKVYKDKVSNGSNPQEEFGAIEKGGAKESNSQLGIGFLTSVPPQRLVEIVCYCLNPNHYHLLLKQLVDEGISKYLHKVGVGYTNYFNLKNQRSGSLFQGKFKSVQIDSEEHLLWVSAYVNGNAQIHGIITDATEYQWCGYPEYLGKGEFNICDKSVILDKFKDIESFQKASDECFNKMKERKDLQKYILD